MKFEKQFPSLAKFHISEKEVRSGIDPKYLTDDLLDKQRVREWFKKKSTKPRASCQDSRRQLEAKQKRVIVRELWEEFEKELGL